MEARSAALLALAQDLLDQAEPDLARARARAMRDRSADRIELHHGPIVAPVLALDTDQAGDPALHLEHEEQVVRAHRDEWQPEQAEHADRRPVDGQAERP